jgi:hypothetical protein
MLVMRPQSLANRDMVTTTAVPGAKEHYHITSLKGGFLGVEIQQRGNTTTVQQLPAQPAEPGPDRLFAAPAHLVIHP